MKQKDIDYKHAADVIMTAKWEKGKLISDKDVNVPLTSVKKK